MAGKFLIRPLRVGKKTVSVSTGRLFSWSRWAWRRRTWRSAARPTHPLPLLSAVFLWLLHIQSLPVLQRRLLWLTLVDTIVDRAWHVLPKYLLVHSSLEKADVVSILRVPHKFYCTRLLKFVSHGTLPLFPRLAFLGEQHQSRFLFHVLFLDVHDQ